MGEDFQDFEYKSWNAFENFLNRLDVRGERRALRTLNMTEFLKPGVKYTAVDVKKYYRNFAKEWHPDKVEPSKKLEAEQMMAKGNEAKGILEAILKENKKDGRNRDD